MDNTKQILTTKLFDLESDSKNEQALKIVDQYSKVSDILERTYRAMGKKNPIQFTISSSTSNGTIKNNAFFSTI